MRHSEDLPPLRVRNPSIGGYPLWAFFFGSVLYWPDWPAVRIWFAVANLAATVVIASWAVTGVRHERKLAAVAVMLSVLAINAFCTTLGIGQFGIIAVALLVTALRSERLERWWCRFAGGVALGLAMSKPSIAIPFIFPYLVQRKWAHLAGMLCYLAVATIVIWRVSGVDLFEMSGAMRAAADHASNRAFKSGQTSILVPQRAHPGKRDELIVPHGLIVLTVALLLMHRFRLRRIEILFAISAVAARSWIHHSSYDDVMLLFLLAPLARHCFQDPNRPLWLAFGVTGVSLWMPARMVAIPGFLQVQMAVWILALVVLLIYDRDRPQDCSGESPVPL